MHHHHSNPYLSIILGSLFGILSFLTENDFIIHFGVDLLKVCLFGFVGGVFGAIGKKVYTKITTKR